MPAPKRYSSMEEFTREEIRADMKVGFSLDDLYADANLDRRVEEREEGPAELDFDF
jgi:hypothetical protein